MELLAKKFLSNPNSGYDSLLELAFLAYQACFQHHRDYVKILNELTVSTHDLDSMAIEEPPSLIRLLDFGERFEEWTTHKEKIQKLKRQFPNCKIGALNTGNIVDLVMSQSIPLPKVFDRIKDLGIDFLLGDDLDFRNPSQLSSWFEIQRAAHESGIQSELVIDVLCTADLHLLWDSLPKLAELQQETKGFYLARIRCEQLSFINQLRICSFVRLILEDLDDVSIRVRQNNLLTNQLKMSFGVNVLERELSDPRHLLSTNELILAIRKSKRIDTSYDFRLLKQEALPFDTIRLYKFQNTTDYTPCDLEEFATHYPLTAIGMLTNRKYPKKTNTEFYLVDYSEILNRSLPSDGKPIYLDFSNFESNDSIELKTIRRFIRNHSEDREFCLIGLQGLWQLCHKLNVSINYLFSALAGDGVKLISSSEDESEENLTTSEVVDIHRAAHDYGIATIAKLELSAPYNGSDHPFWDKFIQSLLALAELQQATGKLRGVMVQESKTAFISLHEYLKSISLSRVVLGQSIEVIAPIRTLSQGILQPQLVNKQSLVDLIPVMQEFGASTIGLLSERELEGLINSSSLYR